MYSSIYTESKEMYDELIEWRRELHKTPELGLELPQLLSFMKNNLTELGMACETKVNGNCIVGYLGSGERCLLLRADMDGLPMFEESRLSYA